MASSTPWWFVVFTGIVALLGVVVGGWLQRRTDLDNWTRTTRLNAYAELVAASHDFMQRFMEGLAGVSPPGSLQRSLQDVAQKASVVGLVGPERVGDSAEALQKSGERLLAAFSDADTMEAWRSSSPEEKNAFPPYREFVGLHDDLIAIGRRTLGTGRGRP
jgi:hypothetical protein